MNRRYFLSSDYSEDVRLGSGPRTIDSTATIDLQNLLTSEITTSGSFDVRGDIWATTFGRLLQSLPIPGLLVDERARIVAANQACSRLSPSVENALDKEFESLFIASTKDSAPVEALKKIISTRIPQTCEGVLDISPKRIWARFSFRSIRINQQRHILVLIEDLTAEKRQVKIQKGYAKRLEAEIARREIAEEQRAESERLYRRVVESATDIIWQADNEGRITMINPVGLEKTGYRLEEIIGRNVLDFVDDEYRAQLESIFKDQRVSNVPTRIHEIPINTKSGSALWLAHNIQIMTHGRNIIGVQSISRDISERKRAEEALKLAYDNLEQRVKDRTRELAQSNDDLKREILERKNTQERLTLARRIIEGTSEGIIVTDTKGVITYVNESFSSQAGYSREELLHQNPRILKSDKHGPRFYREMWNTIEEKGHWQGEVWNKRKDGSYYPKLLSISAITDVSGMVTNYVGFSTDITDIKKTEKRLKQMAHYDSLTGLANRVLFRDRLIQAIIHARRSKEKVALILIDLDRFKDINDMLGHPVGDNLLVLISERLRECVRESDTVGRLGGDEFMVLAPDLHDAREVNLIADRIIETVAEPCQLENREVFVSASMGIAIFPDDGSGPDKLLQNADTALYRAKERGRNNYQFFSEEMNRELMERAQLEGALREALDQGKLELHYQPVLDFSTGKICSSEALLRWRHPTLGWIAPHRIIRLAEDTGLIIPLGEWILKEACERIRLWNEKGLKDFGVAVNISGHQLNRAGFLESVCSILEESAVDPSCLQLELTETAAMGDIEMSSRIFGELRDRGVQVVIDDFGTGYSSLNYLRALPIDALKIDRTFVKDIAEVSSNRAIVSAIVAMGHSLDLKVVVEGIETNEQLCYLWALDCDEWQGYLFSPAVKWEEFEEYLNSCKEASAPGVSWTPELSVHVDKIDDQHKVWCERVNTLYKSVWSGVKVSELREFAGFLSDYARLHFSDEEALMMAHDYPKYDEHKSAHRVLLNKIQLLKQRIAEENITAELVSDLLQELQNWFLEHIRQVDRELGEFIGQGSAKPGLSVVDISPGTDPLVK